MELSNEKRFILRIASILGICQATAWLIMAVTAISLYFKQPEWIIDGSTSYSRTVSLLIYDRYLVKRDDRFILLDPYKDMIIQPTHFQTFMWMYTTSDLLWLINSVRLLQLLRISSQLSMRDVKRRIGAWVGSIITISIIDFIFVCILAADYDHCPANLTGVQSLSEVMFFWVCPLTGGIVLTIAAKGFLLWFLNIGLAIVTTRILIYDCNTPTHTNNI